MGQFCRTTFFTGKFEKPEISYFHPQVKNLPCYPGTQKVTDADSVPYESAFCGYSQMTAFLFHFGLLVTPPKQGTFDNNAPAYVVYNVTTQQTIEGNADPIPLYPRLLYAWNVSSLSMVNSLWDLHTSRLTLSHERPYQVGFFACPEHPVGMASSRAEPATQARPQLKPAHPKTLWHGESR